MLSCNCCNDGSVSQIDSLYLWTCLFMLTGVNKEGTDHIPSSIPSMSITGFQCTIATGAWPHTIVPVKLFAWCTSGTYTLRSALQTFFKNAFLKGLGLTF